MKHGIYKRLILRGEETVLDIYWMGEQVTVDDFNERLMNQAKSIAKDVDMIQVGMDLHEAIDDGKKVDVELGLLEKFVKEVLDLALCPDCKERIEAWATPK